MHCTAWLLETRTVGHDEPGVLVNGKVPFTVFWSTSASRVPGSRTLIIYKGPELEGMLGILHTCMQTALWTCRDPAVGQ